MSFAAVAVGGLALGAGASYMGARAQNKAANRQLSGQAAEAQGARDNMGYAFFGPQDWQDFQTASQNPNAYGPKDKRRQEVLDAQARFFGQHGTAMGNIQTSNDQLLSNGRADLQTMQRNTGQIDALNRGAEDAIAAFGNAGEDRIRREGADALTAANQRAAASLSGMGMNTLVANQQGQNAVRMNNGVQDSLTNLQGQRLEQFLGARARRSQSLFGRKAAEEATQGALTRAQYGATREPTDRMMQMFGGSPFNPYTPLQGANQSAMGSAMGTLGKGMSFFGAAGGQAPGGFMY